MNEAVEFTEWILQNANPSVWAETAGKWWYDDNYYTSQELYDLWIAIK